MAFTLLSMFFGMVVTGYLAHIFDGFLATFALAILLSGIKDGSYLVWLSQWSTLMNKLFPDRLQGEAYGYCYLVNHLAFCVGSQVYPRLFTMFISEGSFFAKHLGIFTMMTYFIIVGCPLILLTALTFRIHTLVKKQDKLDI